MKRPRIVIIGAGLGGSMLASALANTHEVVVIERGASVVDHRFPLVDIATPARLDPHFGSGLGGSTQLWHNGLIEIDEEIFDQHWPIKKAELADYYRQAFFQLSGVVRDRVLETIEVLRKKYAAFGLPSSQLPGLYYPRWPMNVWKNNQLDGRVQVIHGNVTAFQCNGESGITSLSVQGDNQVQQVHGDVFVLAAGGLGSPVLLQKLARSLDLRALRHAGCHYEDHPVGFVGEVQLNAPLYQLWNYSVPGTGGNLRLPLVVTMNGIQVSFQLRPAANFHRNQRRSRVDSVLHGLRHNPWNPLNYVKLLSHWDDVLDILSFKLGIRLPTKNYTLLMMAQMPPSEDCSIWGETDPQTGQERRIRRWILTPAFQDDLKAAVDSVLEQLAPISRNAQLFPDWLSELATGAHHSGTARMSGSADTGVCDSDCRVHGLDNLYVCDGSVIPASGIANTGLTIGALALRLADHLRQRAWKPSARAENYSL